MGDLELEGQGETFKDRLRRYVDNPATDTLGWMRVYLQNQPAVELKRAREGKLYFCVYLLAFDYPDRFTFSEGTHRRSPCTFLSTDCFPLHCSFSHEVVSHSFSPWRSRPGQPDHR
jgi:hypothetical protein